MKAFLCLGRQCYCTLHLFPPVLCHDAVEVLRPCRPAFDIPRVLVTVLVAQHRATLLMTPRRLHGRHQGMNALYE